MSGGKPFVSEWMRDVGNWSLCLVAGLTHERRRQCAIDGFHAVSPSHQGQFSYHFPLRRVLCDCTYIALYKRILHVCARPCDVRCREMPLLSSNNLSSCSRFSSAGTLGAVCFSSRLNDLSCACI